MAYVGSSTNAKTLDGKTKKRRTKVERKNEDAAKGNPGTILCFGELIVDCFGRVENGFFPKFGGAPGNTAIGLRKLGYPAVAFSGMVGSDFFGDFLATTLKEYGVDTNYLFRSEDKPTTLAFVQVDPDGQRTFTFYPGAHDQMTRGTVQAVDLAGTSIFHFGSLTQVDIACAGVTAELLYWARKQGALISYDPNVRLALSRNPRALRNVIGNTINQVGVLKVSDEELEFLTGSKEPHIGCQDLWRNNLQLMVVTMGRRGAFYKTPKVEGMVDGMPAKVVDTTGAGDAFNAGLLYSLAPHVKEGKIEDLEEHVEGAIRFANVVAGLSVTKEGAITSLPTLEEAKVMMAAAGGNST